ncbi:DUF1963 domain-containing protein [Lentibacter algarum]|uniref:DUF1963 domain-containing protein n=1 Tax=Lentibacter algarum TaxID=576131 RepID=UPI001C093D80|nr:DUF1963 domain-containing protein [Lentibacter algarum]MBU2983415.1 DUF1963 domain-containing protein [Lentibacter algarum]
MNRSELIELIAAQLPSGLADQVATLLLPVLFFTTAPDAPEHHTFLGGTPVMSAAITWPTAGPLLNPAPTQNAEFYGQEVTTHISKALPLSFIGQIDLANAPGSALPDTGRLLFFYDTIAGPYESGTRFARVIWDKEPNPAPQPTPKALQGAETAYIAEAKEALARFEMPEIDAETIAVFKAAGMSDEEIEAIINTPAPDLINFDVTESYV